MIDRQLRQRGCSVTAALMLCSFFLSLWLPGTVSIRKPLFFCGHKGGCPNIVIFCADFAYFSYENELFLRISRSRITYNEITVDNFT